MLSMACTQSSLTRTKHYSSPKYIDLQLRVRGENMGCNCFIRCILDHSIKYHYIIHSVIQNFKIFYLVKKI